MTPQLEKVFFNFILKNKKYFDIVKPYFYRNSEIQFVYGVIREYMSKGTDAQVPTPRQILDMVSLEDKEKVGKDLYKDKRVFRWPYGDINKQSRNFAPINKVVGIKSNLIWSFWSS